MLKLESLRETARRAYSGTSMSPERRGDQLVEAHSKELEEDLAGVEEAGPEWHRAEDPPGEQSKYKPSS